MQMIKVFGTEIPRYQDCVKCKRKDACEFDRVAYRQPCEECQAKEPTKSLKWKNGDPFKNQQVAAVWNVKGRNIYTNPKGDIIKDEKARPLPVGQKDWQKH